MTAALSRKVRSAPLTVLRIRGSGSLTARRISCMHVFTCITCLIIYKDSIITFASKVHGGVQCHNDQSHECELALRVKLHCDMYYLISQTHKSSPQTS